MDRRRRRIYTGVLAITALCAQYAAVVMSTPAQPSQKASWNDEEVTALIAHLYEHRSETEGAGNFKDPAWNSAATHIASLLTRGPPKTSKMCQSKWVTVRRWTCCLAPSNLLTGFFQLKRIYNAIETYKKTSGTHWDNERGANIVGDSARKVWNDYVAKKVRRSL